jgi:hypothetical protein
MTQLIDDLKAAKEYMQQKGRCNKGPIGEDGSVCIAVAVGVAAKNFQYEIVDYPNFRDRFHAMLLALAAHIPADTPMLYPTRVGVDRTIDYNEWNKVTDGDVWDLFDKTIANLGGAI